MSTAVGTRPRSAAEPDGRSPAAVADVFVIFGHAALMGDGKRFTHQDAAAVCWRIMQPLLDDPPPVHPYAKRKWGPKEADQLTAGHRGWHEPWVSS